MNDITALAQRLKVYAEEFSYPVLSPDDCRALVEELEARDKQIAELVAGRMNLMRTMGVYVHAYEEAKSHIASLESRTAAVKLPGPLMPAQHNSGELFMTPDNVIHGGYLNCDDVLRNLRAAGIQVIEGEQKNG